VARDLKTVPAGATACGRRYRDADLPGLICRSIASGTCPTCRFVQVDCFPVADSGAIQRAITAPCKGGRLTNSLLAGVGHPSARAVSHPSGPVYMGAQVRHPLLPFASALGSKWRIGSGMQYLPFKKEICEGRAVLCKFGV